MKKNLRFLVVTAVGFVGAVAFSSCAYDPYYTSVGGSYSTGYGAGYGYGGSSFTTDVFVGTGNPRWGYDPYCYSYYDYNRRAYYDPYLNGYYPVGYRPQVVYGVSHPYGWRPGSGYCRPPSRVTNVTIANYRNRESAYRSSGYIPSSGPYRQRPLQGGYNGGNYQTRPSQVSPSYLQIPQVSPPSLPYRQGSGPGSYRTNGTRQAPVLPSRYNSPVTASQPDFSRGNPFMRGESSRSRTAPPTIQPSQRQPREMRQLGQPDLSRPPVQRMQAPPMPQPQAARPTAPQPQIQQPQRLNPQEPPLGFRGDRVGRPPQGGGSGSDRRRRGPGAD